MRVPKQLLFLWFILVINLTIHAQNQTNNDSTTFRKIKEFRFQRAYKLLLGLNLQTNSHAEEDKKIRLYIAEIGLHRTLTARSKFSFPTTFGYGISTEIIMDKNPIYGFKATAWTAGYLFLALGLSTVYYTDFQYGNFKIRPEFGIGSYPFKLTIGYNIPTFYNSDFDRMRQQDTQFTLNVFLKIKELKSKK